MKGEEGKGKRNGNAMFNQWVKSALMISRVSAISPFYQ